MKSNIVIYSLLALTLVACGKAKKKSKYPTPVSSVPGQVRPAPAPVRPLPLPVPGPITPVPPPVNGTFNPGGPINSGDRSWGRGCGKQKRWHKKHNRWHKKRGRFGLVSQIEAVDLQDLDFESSRVENLTENQEIRKECAGSIRFNGDQIEVDLLPTQLQAMGQGVVGERCRIELGLDERVGYRFALRQVDLELQTKLSAGATADLQVSFTTEGMAPALAQATLQEAGLQRHPIQNMFRADELMWSDCGSAADITLETSLMVKSPNSSLEDSSDQDLDSAAISPSMPLRFELIWAPCS